LLRKLIGLTALVEAVTGLALIFDPAMVARLLLGIVPSAAGTALGRVAGLALLSLGLACWPQREPAWPTGPTVLAMFIYNVLITVYLTWLGVGTELTGSVLWPAVGIHAILTFLLAWAWFQEQRIQKRIVSRAQRSYDD